MKNKDGESILDVLLALLLLLLNEAAGRNESSKNPTNSNAFLSRKVDTFNLFAERITE